MPDDPLTGEQWFTTAEVAVRYRTVPGTVRYWRHIGYGPKGVKVGKKVLYPEDQIKQFDQLLARRLRESA